MLGVVMQDDQLFAGSIADNISFFADTPDFQRIEECAKAAAVHDDIMAMPMAFGTLIGDMGSRSRMARYSNISIPCSTMVTGMGATPSMTRTGCLQSLFHPRPISLPNAAA
jgi:hypothetical protein